MKAVDPTILIGANGESDTWWRTVLTGASSAIDFLAIHNYPAMDWGSFTYYQQNNVNLMRPVQTAQAAIKAYAPAVDRERLTIASTEINSADWSGAWPHRNDLGHAIVLFDLLGAHLANPNVAFAQLWNTRWSGNDTATTPVLWDALDKNNDLQATGRVTSIWGQFLKDKLVSSSSTTKVRTYTTYSPASGKLSVFLINKDSVPRSASVTINGGGSGYSVSTWVFSGSGAEDVRPIWQHEGESSNTGNVISATLPPVSLTVLDLAPDGVVHPIPGTVEAEDFRAGGSWDSTSGNAGGVYRATDVDIQVTSDVGAGFNVAWIAAGESLEYALYVAKAGYYDVSARVASPYAGKWFQVLLDGQDVTGNIGVPTTGAWQKWQTVTAAGVYIPAGTHRMMFSTPSGGFNLNWLALSASARRTPTVPGIIQAEDFLEGSYWDATSGNYGGVYRATDVDVQTSSDTGGGFNVGWVAAGEWLDYAFDVPIAGYYDLAARVASPLSGKSIAVRLDGSDLPGNVAIPNTGAWQNWQTVTRTGIYLSSGPHRIRITAVTDGFNLNWLSLTAATLTSPARRIEIEAENFDDGAYWDSTSGNLGAAYRATDVDIQPTSDVGGGFNLAWIAPGEWQEYAIQVITPGAYDLSARVASPHSGKSFYVLLDGKDVTGAIAVPTTGGYQSWQTVTRPSIYLTAGTHRLRLVANTSGFNLNWLALAPTP
jgi:hypothetical protein